MNRITEIQKRRTGYSSGFVESASGVAAGGRTGLTAVTAAVLFLLSMFIAPVAAIIPAAVTSSALIYVGILMLANLRIYRTRHRPGPDQLYSHQAYCGIKKKHLKGAFSFLRLCRQTFMDDGQDRLIEPGLKISK